MSNPFHVVVTGSRRWTDWPRHGKAAGLTVITCQHAQTDDTELDKENPMKALTIAQPWAWAITALDKRVENRTWSTRYRGPLLLHAGGRIDRHALDHPWITEEMACFPPDATPDTLLYTGAILARADLIDCHHATECQTRCNRWAEPHTWHWILTDIQPITRIPATGAPGLWRPTATLTAHATERTAA